jgi:hypothetical protein
MLVRVQPTVLSRAIWTQHVPTSSCTQPIPLAVTGITTATPGHAASTGTRTTLQYCRQCLRLLQPARSGWIPTVQTLLPKGASSCRGYCNGAAAVGPFAAINDKMVCQLQALQVPGSWQPSSPQTTPTRGVLTQPVLQSQSPLLQSPQLQQLARKPRLVV